MKKVDANQKKIVTASCGCEVPATKKFSAKHVCAKCRGLFCDDHLYTYVDESNAAITKNSRPHCRKCFLETYDLKFL